MINKKYIWISVLILLILTTAAYSITGTNIKEEVRQFAVDKTSPAISYSAETAGNNSVLNQSYIEVYVDFTELNIQNITYALWNYTGIVNETTAETNLNYIKWINLRKSFNATYWYNVTIYDKAGYNNYTEIRKVILNTPPRYNTTIPNQSLNSGTVYADLINLDEYFYDDDNNALSYSFSGNSTIVIIINSTTNNVTITTPNTNVIENIIFTASDGLNTTSSINITITVTAITAPSSAEMIGGASKEEGATVVPAEVTEAITKEAVTDSKIINEISASLPEWKNVEIYQEFTIIEEIEPIEIEELLPYAKEREAIEIINDVQNKVSTGKLSQLTVTKRLDVYNVVNKDTEEYDYRSKITLTITSTEDLEDVKIIDVISKDAAESADDIIFYGETPKILQKDPIFEWNFKEIKKDKSKSVYYIIKKKVDIELTTIATSKAAMPEEMPIEVAPLPVKIIILAVAIVIILTAIISSRKRLLKEIIILYRNIKYLFYTKREREVIKRREELEKIKKYRKSILEKKKKELERIRRSNEEELNKIKEEREEELRKIRRKRRKRETKSKLKRLISRLKKETKEFLHHIGFAAKEERIIRRKEELKILEEEKLKELKEEKKKREKELERIKKEKLAREREKEEILKKLREEREKRLIEIKEERKRKEWVIKNRLKKRKRIGIKKIKSKIREAGLEVLHSLKIYKTEKEKEKIIWKKKLDDLKDEKLKRLDEIKKEKEKKLEDIRKERLAREKEKEEVLKKLREERERRLKSRRAN